MSKKKLLHVLYSGQGGLGTYFMNFVDSDRDNIFEHYAFFYGIEPLDDELRNYCVSHEIKYVYIQRTSKVGLKALREVLRFAKKYKTNVVLLHTFSLSLLTVFSLFKRFKLIAIDHTSAQFKTSFEWVATMLNHVLATEMIYFYPGHFEEVRKRIPILWSDRHSHNVPKNVNIEYFKPSDQKKSSQTLVLGTATRLVKGKRHDIAIEAIAAIRVQGKNIRLKIAGVGPEEQHLKNLVKALNLEDAVSFCGKLERSEILEFYQSLDVYLHPSNGETICYSIMEAQACGLPVLASDVKGINNTISKENGGILFANNPDSLKNVLLSIVDKQIDLSIYQKNARPHAVSIYHRDNMVSKYFDIIGDN